MTVAVNPTHSVAGRPDYQQRTLVIISKRWHMHDGTWWPHLSTRCGGRFTNTSAGQDRPVSREEAADARAVSRNLAAFHLDKLVDAGLAARSL